MIKIKRNVALSVGLGAVLSTLTGAAWAQTYAFEGSSDTVYGEPKYLAYYEEYSEACGSVNELDVSPIFGPKSEFEEKYPIIGQMDAELAQVADINPDIISAIKPIFAKAKKSIDFGYQVKATQERQIVDIQAENDKTPGVTRYARGQIDRAWDATLKSMRSTERGAQQQAIALLDERMDPRTMRPIRRADPTLTNSDKAEPPPTDYDRWQQCRAFWGYQTDNAATIRGRGVDAF